MTRALLFLLALLASLPAAADMYQDARNAELPAALYNLGAMARDGSNAKQPQALNNLTKTGGAYYAPAYGTCTWSATTDVGACINQAIEAAAASGGGTVTIPVGTYGVSTPITTGSDHVGIACNASSGSRAASAPYTTPAGPEMGGCELKWIGAPAGKIVSFIAPNDTRSIVGARIENIKFNGNNGLAAAGLYLEGANGGRFIGLNFVGGFNAGNVIELASSPGDHLQGVGGVQWNHFYDTRIHNWGYTSNGIKLGFYQSANPGSIGTNASLNRFDTLHLFTGNGATGKGIWCRGCDNNSFEMAYVSTGDGSTAVDLDIYTDNGHWFPAIGNRFDQVAWRPGTVAVSRGKTTYPSCTAYGFPTLGTCAWGNEFRGIDGSNGTPVPVIEPGAYAKYAFDYGVHVNSGSWLAGDGQRAAQTIMAGFGDLHACGNDSIAYGAGLGSHYCIYNAPAQLFSSGIATVGQQDHFTVGLAGTTPGVENLRWNRPLGTGLYEFADAPVKPATATVATLPACGAARKHGVMAVSDQNGVPTYRGVLTGGGALAVLAYCNGTAWEAH